MGRGRAKAKQTKVARELKYHSPSMDLDALQRELSGDRKSNDYDEYDEYGDYRDEYEEDEADSGRSRSRRR